MLFLFPYRYSCNSSQWATPLQTEIYNVLLVKQTYNRHGIIGLEL